MSLLPRRSRRRRLQPISASPTVAGDRDLVQTVLPHVPAESIYALTVATVSSTQTRLTTIGAPLDATFEIGSVGKGVTGMLYADALDRRDVTQQTTLGEAFDLTSREAASITLDELSQHRSGLPPLPLRLRDQLRMTAMTALAKNPTNVSAERIPRLLDQVRVGAKEPEYSNLGFAALGHALARFGGTDYPTLLRERIAAPLELSRFYVPAGNAVRPGHNTVQGRDARGRAQQAWTDSGYAPAGGIRADAASMAALASALLDGSAPGLRSLTPTANFSPDGEDRIGYGWMTSEISGRTITWHNGGTGGFAAWLGLDREHDTAVFIAGATTEHLDRAGEALLLGLSSDS